MALTLRPTGLHSPAFAQLTDVCVYDDGESIGRIYERHAPFRPELAWFWALHLGGPARHHVQTDGNAVLARAGEHDPAVLFGFDGDRVNVRQEFSKKIITAIVNHEMMASLETDKPLCRRNDVLEVLLSQLHRRLLIAAPVKAEHRCSEVQAQGPEINTAHFRE